MARNPWKIIFIVAVLVEISAGASDIETTVNTSGITNATPSTDESTSPSNTISSPIIDETSRQNTTSHENTTNTENTDNGIAPDATVLPTDIIDVQDDAITVMPIEDEPSETPERDGKLLHIPNIPVVLNEFETVAIPDAIQIIHNDNLIPSDADDVDVTDLSNAPEVVNYPSSENEYELAPVVPLGKEPQPVVELDEEYIVMNVTKKKKNTGTTAMSSSTTAATEHAGHILVIPTKDSHEVEDVPENQTAIPDDRMIPEIIPVGGNESVESVTPIIPVSTDEITKVTTVETTSFGYTTEIVNTPVVSSGNESIIAKNEAVESTDTSSTITTTASTVGTVPTVLDLNEEVIKEVVDDTTNDKINVILSEVDSSTDGDNKQEEGKAAVEAGTLEVPAITEATEAAEKQETTIEAKNSDQTELPKESDSSTETNPSETYPVAIIGKESNDTSVETTTSDGATTSGTSTDDFTFSQEDVSNESLHLNNQTTTEAHIGTEATVDNSTESMVTGFDDYSEEDQTDEVTTVKAGIESYESNETDPFIYGHQTTLGVGRSDNPFFDILSSSKPPLNQSRTNEDLMKILSTHFTTHSSTKPTPRDKSEEVKSEKSGEVDEVGNKKTDTKVPSVSSEENVSDSHCPLCNVITKEGKGLKVEPTVKVPVLLPEPTVVAEVEPNVGFYVYNQDVACIMMSSDIKINISYGASKISWKVIEVPKNANISGSCTDGNSFMLIQWPARMSKRIGRQITTESTDKESKESKKVMNSIYLFMDQDEDMYYYIRKVTATINLDADILEGDKENKGLLGTTIVKSLDNVILFKTPLYQTYFCNKTITLSLDDKNDEDVNSNIVLHFNHFQYHAFNKNKLNGFINRYNCELEDRSPRLALVLFILSIALTSVVIMLILVTLILRRYKVRKVQLKSKNDIKNL